MKYQIKKNKIRRIIELVLFMGTIFALGGCGNKSEEPVSITYEELEESQQKIIDGVYNSYSNWESVYDSGQDFYCTNVTFFKEDGVIIFATYYKVRTDKEYNSIFGFCKTFEVNVENGELSKHTYSLFGNSAQAKRGAAEARAANGQEFNTNANEITIKDTLAKAYYNVIID